MPKFSAALSPSVLGLILATVVMLAAGQILFKQAAGGLSLAKPLSLVSWPLIAALALYGVATLTWLLVLARVRLSVAYPFYGLTFLLVPLLAWLLLKEPLRPQVVIGGLIIMIGVAISSMGTK